MDERPLHENAILPRTTLWICFALLAVTIGVYWQVHDHDFISLDDLDYVYQNPHAVTGLTAENFIWAFGIHGPGQWHPLTWLSHQLDCQLFGLNPGAHHLVNLGMHLISVLLLFLAMKRLTFSIWPSAYVAALFALHPLNVESVAWVSERRDVLSTLFWMLTMLAYLAYVQRPNVGRFALVALWLALGLMAKPMLVTLPCVLLLLDVWPLGRLRIGQRLHPTWREAIAPQSARWLVIEKLPLLALSIVSSYLTVLCQQSVNAIGSLESYPFGMRLGNAVLAYAAFLRKLFWPTDLAVFYPYPTSIDTMQVAGAGMLLLAITVAVAYAWRPWPYMAVGWLWFLGTLVPVIGLVSVGSAAMADRYAYVPNIGLFIALTWGTKDLLDWQKINRGTVVAIAAVPLLLLAMYSWVQLGYWQDGLTLYEHSLKVTSGNYSAHSNLGADYLLMGQWDKSEHHFREALKISPGHTPALNGLGVVLEYQCRQRDAIMLYAGMLQRGDIRSYAMSRLAWLLSTSSDPALRNGEEALRMALEYVESRPMPNAFDFDILAAAYAESGQFESAINYASRAAALAAESGNVQLADEIENRIALYRKGQAYRTPLAPAG